MGGIHREWPVVIPIVNAESPRRLQSPRTVIDAIWPYPGVDEGDRFNQPTRAWSRPRATREGLTERFPQLTKLLMNEHISDNLDRKYRIALAVVAVLVLGNEVLVQPYMMRLTTDAPLINTAGRQRMLSQRLAKAALAFDGGKGERAKAYLEEMRQVLGLWSASHEQLLRGD